MIDQFPLMLFSGLGGSLLLLLVGSVSPLRKHQLLLSAAWTTLLTVLWLLVPVEGRWVLSVWAPSSVLEGWLIADITPSLWLCGVAIGLMISGALWVSVAERRYELPLTGALLVIFLTITFVMLLSGTVLMTLAMWAAFDLFWLVSRLMAGGDGNRVLWSAALHGTSSLLLWGVSLLMLERGESSLWWLMNPSQPALILLTAAGLIRFGFYPFQIVFPATVSSSRTLTLIGLMGPLSGVSLLYRVFDLPGAENLSSIFVVWGSISVLWLGVIAFVNSDRRASSLWGARAVLLAIVTASIASHFSSWLLIGAVAWLSTAALLISTRSWFRRQPFWSLLRGFAICLLLGAPISVLGQTYSLSLTSVLIPQIVMVIGLALANGSLMDALSQTAQARIDEPWPAQRITRIVGFLMIVISLVVLTPLAPQVRFTWMAFGLWGVAFLLGVALATRRDILITSIQRWIPALNFLDMSWAYRSIWQGSENLFGILRVTSEVLEGSGSILWSVLILLLVLMIAGSR